MEMYLVKYDEHDGEVKYITFPTTKLDAMLKWMSQSKWIHFESVQLVRVIENYNLSFTLTKV